MSSTVSNDFSSRSHAVIQISIEWKPLDSSKPIISSKLSIVDLAGSEKESYDLKEQKQRLEGSNINRSLLALASCIKTLTEKGNDKNA